jgi:hypothetical protein
MKQWPEFDQNDDLPIGIHQGTRGYLAEIDRMNLEVREYLSLHPSELKEQAA